MPTDGSFCLSGDVKVLSVDEDEEDELPSLGGVEVNTMFSRDESVTVSLGDANGVSDEDDDFADWEARACCRWFL